MSRSASTFFFLARLSPEGDCRGFNPGELSLGDGWILDICYDLMCLWNPRVGGTFPDTKLFVREACNLLTDLYSFKADKVLAFELRNWVETKEMESLKNVIGTFLPNVQPGRKPSPASEGSRRWKRVAKAFLCIHNNPHLRLSIKDYVSAIRDSGDDAFFFAYRAIESICRSASGATGDLQPSDWTTMHSRLGTTKSKIDPLTSVATAIRHGDVKSMVLVNARANRDHLLTIAREVMVTEFKRSVKGFC